LPSDPDQGWPSKGQINFVDVELRYRDDLPLILKGLNLSISGGEKVSLHGDAKLKIRSVLLVALELERVVSLKRCSERLSSAEAGLR